MTDTGAAADGVGPAPGRATHSLLTDLRRLRVEAGEPSYATLARRSGFGRSTVHGALTGDRLPTQDLTVAVAEALGANAQEWRERWTQARVEEADSGPEAWGPEATGTDRRPRHRLIAAVSAAGVTVVVTAVVVGLLAARGGDQGPRRDGRTTAVAAASCTGVRTYRATDNGNVLDAGGTVLGSLKAGATVGVPDTADRGPYQNRYAATVRGDTVLRGYVDIAKLDLVSPACP